MNGRFRMVLAATVFVAGMGWLAWNWSSHLPAGLAWIRTSGAPGVAVFLLLYALSVVVAVPVTWSAALAGWLWGGVAGAAIAWPASLAGSVLAFWVARRLLRDAAERRLQSSPRLAAVDEALGEGGAGLVVLLRLCMPNNFLNFGLAASRVRLRDFALGSAIGVAPLAILFAAGGALAGDLAEVLKTRDRLGAWPLVLTGCGVVAAIATLVYLARAARRALDRRLAR
jgi:uncharacterized membrane protein YdjX (TVP38/TMEM64 family)